MSTLILVSSHTEEDSIEATRFMLKEGGEIDVVSSAEEYEKSFPLYGTWQGWINYVSSGVDYLSRLPIFSKFVVIDEQLGRANASIIEKALDIGKECVYFNGKEFYSILSVSPCGDDWQNGWEISTL